MMKCRICEVELNQPMAPETMDCAGDCARCMAEFDDPECIQLLKNLADPAKHAAEIAACEVRRTKKL
jgi:hypothetical protein